MTLSILAGAYRLEEAHCLIRVRVSPPPSPFLGKKKFLTNHPDRNPQSGRQFCFYVH